MKKALLMLVCGFVLGVALTASAANRTVTFIPPADGTSLSSICLARASCVAGADGGCVTGVMVTVTGCATAADGSQECVTPPAVGIPATDNRVAAFLTAAHNYWKAQNGKGY